jgi:hypothetical protein
MAPLQTKAAGKDATSSTGFGGAQHARWFKISVQSGELSNNDLKLRANKRLQGSHGA